MPTTISVMNRSTDMTRTCFRVFMPKPRYRGERSSRLLGLYREAGVVQRAFGDLAGVDADLLGVGVDGQLHAVEGARRRPEDAHAGVGVGRAVAGAAEPAARVLPGDRIRPDESLLPRHGAAEVGALPPEGEQAGAALLLGQVDEPELALRPLLLRPGQDLVHGARGDDAAEAGDMARVEEVDARRRDGGQPGTQARPECDAQQAATRYLLRLEALGGDYGASRRLRGEDAVGNRHEESPLDH